MTSTERMPTVAGTLTVGPAETGWEWDDDRFEDGYTRDQMHEDLVSPDPAVRAKAVDYYLYGQPAGGLYTSLREAECPRCGAYMDRYACGCVRSVRNVTPA